MLEKLQNIIREAAEKDDLIVTEDTILLSDLGLNSLELIQMVCDVEEMFGIEISDRVLNTLKTIKDIISYIEERRNGLPA